MTPSAQIIKEKNTTNDHFCRHLVNDKILVTRVEYEKVCKKTRSSRTSYKSNVVWDYPAVAVTSFDINGNHTCSNYSRLAYQSSYNTILTNKLNSIDPVKRIGDNRNGTIIGHCAEPHTANQTMNSYRKKQKKDLQLSEVYFSSAKRPRTMEIIQTCQNCKDTFPNL
jgi:hypothetical protein